MYVLRNSIEVSIVVVLTASFAVDTKKETSQCGENNICYPYLYNIESKLVGHGFCRPKKENQIKIKKDEICFPKFETEKMCDSNLVCEQSVGNKVLGICN